MHDDPAADGRWLAIALATAASLFVYLLTAIPFIVGADNAEFVTLSVSAGTAHPPGYPLYTAYLRAMSWLPGSSIPHTAALATALLGAAAVGVFTDALRGWGFRSSTAAAAALVFAFDPHVWKLATHAEVFALNNLIAAAIFWAAAPQSPRRGLARAATLGFLAGMGLANHHSIVMLAPIGIYGMVHAARESRSRVLPLILGVAAGILGLAPYLYLGMTASDCVDCLQWGDPSSLAELWRVVTRAEYGSTSLGAGGERLPLENLGAFFARLALGAPVGVVLAVVGLIAMFRQLRSDALPPMGRAGAAAIIAGFLLCGPAFIALFNIEPTGIGAEIVARFYALPALALAPIVAAAIERLPRMLGPVAVVATILVSAFSVVGFHTSAIEDYSRDLLAPLPEQTILLGTGDHRMFGVHYQQLARNFRTDVVYIDGRLLAHAWYVERVERRTGIELPYEADAIPIAEIVGALTGSGRPVFFTHVFAESLRAFPTYPYGVSVKLSVGERPPPPGELGALNAQLYESFTLRPRPAEVRSAWEREVFEHYARTWTSLAAVFERLGDAEGAAFARTFAVLFQPESGAGAPSAPAP